MRRIKKTSLSASAAPMLLSVPFVATAPACHSESDAERPEAGSVRTGMATSGTAHDVTQVRFWVVQSLLTCSATPLQQSTQDLQASSAPQAAPSAAATVHNHSSSFFVLDPGNYRVCAQPLRRNGYNSLFCGLAQTTTTVVESAVAEVTLVSSCVGNDDGALDNILILNDPPSIDDLEVSPSRNVSTCETVTMEVSASDANDDDLTYEWSQLAGPSTLDLDVDGDSASFSTSVLGDYQIKVAVDDGYAVSSTSISGSSTLSFYVHVDENGCGRAPSAIEGEQIGLVDDQARDPIKEALLRVKDRAQR